MSTIISVPKTKRPKEMKDFRPVALTSLIMKTMERLVKKIILAVSEVKLDPLQFAYRAARGVEDAKIFLIEKLVSHLEKPNSHARLLFADFSSAFNLMQPHLLSKKLLNEFGLSNQVVLWTLNFLTNRPQRVKVNGSLSESKLTNTGSPQGCCLSAILYILYTDSCRCKEENRFLIKFADDSALLSLLFDKEVEHGEALDSFVKWCNDSYLKLNVSKTKDMIIDFRRNPSNEPKHKTIIENKEVETVSSYKYLGTTFDDKLKWSDNTDDIVKKCNQRMYFLRKLNSFGVDKKVTELFYSSFIESVLYVFLYLLVWQPRR